MPVLVSMDMSVGMLMDVLMRMTMRMVVAVTVLAVVHWEVSLKRWNRRRCQQLAGEIWPLRLTFECFRTSILFSDLTGSGSRRSYSMKR